MDLVSCKASLTLLEVFFNSLIFIDSSLACIKDIVPTIIFIDITHTKQSQT